MGVNQGLRVASAHWQTPLLVCIFSFFLHFLFFFLLLMEKDAEMLKNMIWTNEGHAKHPFAGQNTQQPTENLVEKYYLII